MTPRAVEVAAQALLLVLTLAAPALAAVFVVTALLGAVTSRLRLDPSSLTAPRVAAVALAVVTFGPWGARAVLAFTRGLFTELPTLVR